MRSRDKSEVRRQKEGEWKNKGRTINSALYKFEWILNV